MLACDFFVTVTAGFRVLYVFVVMEVRSRRLVHVNVTRHPTAAWALQQVRDVRAEEPAYRLVLQDRDVISSPGPDEARAAMGARVRRSPVRAPQAHVFCECLIGTLRRECPDSVSPLTEAHLRRILRERASHYNRGRPHASLGPGLPEPSADLPVRSISGHHLPSLHRVVARPILGGLPHDYRPEKVAAYEQGVLVDHTL